MNRKYLVLAIPTLILMLLLLLASCSKESGVTSPPGPPSSQATSTSTSSLPTAGNPVSASPSPTPSPSVPISQARQIVNNAISAMSKVNTFKLNVDINFKEILYHTADITDKPQTYSYDGNRIVDLPNKTMQMALNTDLDYSGTKNQEILQMYIVDGFIYFHDIPISTSPDSTTSWTKNKLTDDTWQQEAQISEQIEMLQSATKVNLAGSDNLHGTDCYVLEITPSARAITDWVVSQGEPSSPNFGGAFGPALVGDVFGKTYQGNPFQEWIAKDSYLVMRVDLDPVFVARPADIAWPGFPTPPPSNSFQKLTAEFKGQMFFSDYNQPVSIQLPPEAAHAREQ